MKRALRYCTSVPAAIWGIGFASFFLNISSIILFSLSSIYLATNLGVDAISIGWLEGCVEGIAYLSKLFSGIVSDILKKRKWVMVIGFALCVLARPIMAMRLSYWNVFLARVLDRIGNGIQATPRDALVGDIAPSEIRGRAFGLRQALTTLGSLTGGILGGILLKQTHNDLSIVFAIATIPAVIGLILLLVIVKDAPFSKKEQAHKLTFKDWRFLNKEYWLLIIVSFVFMLARLGEAFLILHGKTSFKIDMSYVPYIATVYNCATAIIAYPVGRLSDRIDRHIVLGIGIFVMMITSTLFYTRCDELSFWIGAFLWGIQMGITQSMFVVIIADIVPRGVRGTAEGFFHLFNAFGYLISSQIAGSITHCASVRDTFLFSVCLSTLSFFLFFGINAKRFLKKNV